MSEAKVPLLRDERTGRPAGPLVQQRDGMQRQARGEQVKRQGRGAAWVQRRPADPQVMPDGQAWNDASGSRWTPDLVHCRIVEACTVLKRLPPANGPRGYVSILGQLSLDPPERMSGPPSTAEINLCEWTLDQLGDLQVTDRFIAYGFGLGLSSRQIERELGRSASFVPGVRALGKSMIINRYTVAQCALAVIWNDKGHKVDRGTYERWQAWLEHHKIGLDRLDR